MSVTIEGVFKIADTQAVAALEKIENRAKAATAALEAQGAAMDAQHSKKSAASINEVSTAQEKLARQTRSTTTAAESSTRASDNAGRAHGRAATQTKTHARQVGNLEQSYKGHNRMAARATQETKNFSNALDRSINTGVLGHFQNLGSVIDAVTKGFGMFAAAGAAVAASALPVAIATAAQAVGALAGGVVALLPQLISLTGVLGALPGMFSAMAQGAVTAMAALKPALGAVALGFKAQQAQATEGIALNDQLRQGHHAVASAAWGVMTANEAVAEAERGIMLAQRSSTDAQKDLTAARREALRNLQDMKLAAQDALLGEKGAKLQLERDQRALATGTFTGVNADLDQQNAVLAVQQDQLNVARQTHQAHRSAADNMRAQRLGVRGNRSVISAERGVNDAAHGEMLAQRGVRDALHGVAEAAFAASEAQIQLSRTMSYGTSGNHAYEVALKQLAPNAREFVKELVAMRPALKDLQSAAGEELFPRLLTTLGRVRTFLPTIRPILKRTGGAVGRGIDNVVRQATDHPDDATTLGNMNVQIIDKAGRAAGFLADGLRRFMVAAKPFTLWVMDTFVGWAKHMDAAAMHTQKITDFLDKSRRAMRLFGEMTHNTFKAFMLIMEAATPLGDRLWGGALKGTQNWVTYLQNHQAEVQGWFDKLYTPLHLMGQIVKQLAIEWAKLTVSPGMTGALKAMQGATPALGKLLTSLATVGPSAFTALANVLGLFAALPVNPLRIALDLMGRIASMMTTVVKEVPAAGAVFSALFAGAAIVKLANYLAGLKAIRGVMMQIGGQRLPTGAGVGSPDVTGRRFGGQGIPSATAMMKPVAVYVTNWEMMPGGPGRGGRGVPYGGTPTGPAGSRIGPEGYVGPRGVGVPSYAQGYREAQGGMSGPVVPGTPAYAAAYQRSQAAAAAAANPGRWTRFKGAASRFGGGATAAAATAGGALFSAPGMVATMYAAPQIERIISAKNKPAQAKNELVNDLGVARYMPLVGSVASLLHGDRLDHVVENVAGKGIPDLVSAGYNWITGAPDKKPTDAKSGTKAASTYIQKHVKGGLRGPANLTEARMAVSQVERAHDLVVSREKGQGFASKKDIAEAQAYTRALKALKAAKQGLVDTKDQQKVDRFSQSLGGIFDVYMHHSKNAARAGKQTTNQMWDQMKTLHMRGKQTLAQSGLDWITQMSKTQKGMGGQAKAMRQRIISEFHAMDKSVAIINGQILVGNREIWKGISASLSDPIEVARQKLHRGFTAMQNDAVKGLKDMGFSNGQARGIVSGLEKGGAAGAVARSDAANGPNEQQAYQAPQPSAGATGMRIKGQGLNDSVPVAPGHIAAPGELIVNRHTERRIDGVLGQFGTSLGREVAGEKTPHWAYATGGRLMAHGGRTKRARVGYTVYDDPPPGAFGSLAGGYAELGTASRNTGGATGHGWIAKALGLRGELAAHTPLSISINGHTKTLRKQDRGYGQGGDGTTSDPNYALDVWKDSWGTFGLNANSSGMANIALDGEAATMPAGGGGGGGAAAEVVRRIHLKQRRVKGQGVAGIMADRALRARRVGMQRKLNEALAASQPAGDSGGATGPAGGPTGTRLFDGKAVAKWIYPALVYARRHGWHGSVTSGYRSPERNAAVGGAAGSNHMSTQYPGGAVDVGGPEDAAAGAALRNALHGYKGRMPLQGTLARGNNWSSVGDLGHFSATGRAMGGRIDWGGWNAKGGQFTVDRPTVFGAGERGKETVTITPAGKGGKPVIKVDIGHITNHEPGDIKKILHRELEGLISDLDIVGADHG